MNFEIQTQACAVVENDFEQQPSEKIEMPNLNFHPEKITLGSSQDPETGRMSQLEDKFKQLGVQF